MGTAVVPAFTEQQHLGRVSAGCTNTVCVASQALAVARCGTQGGQQGGHVTRGVGFDGDSHEYSLAVYCAAVALGVLSTVGERLSYAQSAVQFQTMICLRHNLLGHHRPEQQAKMDPRC